MFAQPELNQIIKRKKEQKMDSLVAVEKEVDKALDSFDNFYQKIDNDADTVLENILTSMNELMKSNHQHLLLKTTSPI